MAKKNNWRKYKRFVGFVVTVDFEIDYPTLRAIEKNILDVMNNFNTCGYSQRIFADKDKDEVLVGIIKDKTGLQRVEVIK